MDLEKYNVQYEKRFWIGLLSKISVLLKNQNKNEWILKIKHHRFITTKPDISKMTKSDKSNKVITSKHHPRHTSDSKFKLSIREHHQFLFNPLIIPFKYHHKKFLLRITSSTHQTWHMAIPKRLLERHLYEYRKKKSVQASAVLTFQRDHLLTCSA